MEEQPREIEGNGIQGAEEVRDILAGKVVFGGRFEVVEELGRGSQGITYLARELLTGRQVVVKQLAVRDSPDWKSIELFEREGQVLKSLHHKGIPRYIDAFHELEGDSKYERFGLVQEYVTGENLEVLIAQGLRMDEAGMRDFLEQMLEILAYLHGLEPPVIHRDIKPSNIMRRADGRWILIDFGGVSVAARGVDSSKGASTVVGTSGYMPFEQLVGRAVAASDLYALGATAVHLLSHRHPSDLPVDAAEPMRMLFQEYVTTTPAIMELLERMLEPFWEDRIQSAQVALELLRTKRREENVSRALVVGARVEQRLAQRSAVYASDELALQNMQISVGRTAKRVRFGVVRRGSSAREWHIEEYMVAMIVLLGLGIAAMRTFYLYVYPVMSAAFVAACLCVWLLTAVYRRWRRSKKYLEITTTDMRIPVGLLGGWKRRIALDRVYDVYAMRKHEVNDHEIGYVVAFELDGGEKVLRFGTGQTLPESEWMAEEIRTVIDLNRNQVK